MATTLFPTSQTRNPTNTFSTADTRILSLTRGVAVVSQADATVAALVAAANPQGTGSVAPWKRAAGITLAAAGTVESGATIGASLFWVSPPLGAITIAGSITANIRGLENSALANYGAGCKIYRVHGGVVDAAFAQGSSLSEFTTSESALSITLTPTSTALAAGDSLGVLIFYVGIGTSTSAHTATGFWSGLSGATGDTFFTFTETIVGAPFSHGVVAEQSVMRAATW